LLADSDIQPLKPEKLDAGAPRTSKPHEISLIEDIPLKITVVLGNAKKTISDIINLEIGSIIVLDKPAGDPCELFINGKSAAVGEIIIVEDNYGIRVTELRGSPD